MKSEEEYQIDLRRFARFKRKFPWQLIIKIIIAGLILGLLYLGSKWLINKTDNQDKEDNGIEVDVEL